jgi:hypothetical protein
MASPSVRKPVLNLTANVGKNPAARAEREAAGQEESIELDLRRTDRAVEADLQARLASVGLQIGMWLYLRAL